MTHPTEYDIKSALEYGSFLHGKNCSPEQRMISDLTKEVNRLTSKDVSKTLKIERLREAGGLMRDWIGNEEMTITERWDSASA
jgi:hypothetical protein